MSPSSRKGALRVGIIGAAGLGAGRLIDILLRHPYAELVSLVSESSPGTPAWSAHPQLRHTSLKFEDFNIKKLSSCDIIFSCKRPGETFPFIQEILAAGCRVIDLSADYRLKNASEYPQWYGFEHLFPKLLREAVYGLPELYRAKIAKARLVANPGCYTTTAILACAPIVKAGIGVRYPIMIDAISGVSGAGRAPKLENQFIAVAENVRAYRIGNHQHTPEIEQELTAAATKMRRSKANPHSIRILFVPHVGPYKVGIMADCFLRLAEDESLPTVDELYQILSEAYAGEPFVRVYPPDSLPQIEAVANTNYCDLGVRVDPRTRTVVVISVTDNLLKGAAGQAVQNMNIMFGIEETTGLVGRL
ncbi:MAG: N-acetyl-gamma-glutamyl-phosphate reductase [Candidatus Sumerlaeaceae bacterium]|nr:N-acetyl-gamma-glutamyl-phosphate reductase [Candidatus Sumerlaeaceae bacterium]